MCGIAGQARTDGQVVDALVVEAMCAAQRHRGPDSRGVHVAEGVGLGIQRLRVIDIETGDQPVCNEDGTVVAVLNGEIYNHAELRRDLEARGHRFATRGADSEVIPHLYEEYGARCVERLSGMFGLAVWDARRRRLLLARDRLGKKPLHYAVDGGTLRFASELAALVADPAVRREPDHLALDAFLGLRWVPAPRTAFAGVRKLEPGCRLVFEDGRAAIDRYWSLDYEPKPERVAPEELAAELRDRLRAAVRRRMESDVPLGAFLSGGIDSSAVVAAMAEASPRPVRTFSIGFEGAARSELPQARAVAQRFGTDHQELVVRPDAVDLLPRIVRHHGEPFGDSSAVPSFRLAEMAAREVTVVLTGDGGDESFGGYQRYVSCVAAARLGHIPFPMRRAMAAAAARLPDSDRQDGTASRLRRFGRSLALEPGERYARYMLGATGLDVERLYTPEHRERIGGSLAEEAIAEPWAASRAGALVDRMLDVDVHTYLPDDLLAKVDIATMAHSLEARSPWLDHELVSWAATLAPAEKVRGGEKKALVRRALRGWVPDEVLDAPKQGFQMPVAQWLRGSLGSYARDVLLDERTVERGIFDRTHVAGLLDRHAAGRADHQHAIWALLVHELWHREFLSGPVEASGSGRGLQRSALV